VDLDESCLVAEEPEDDLEAVSEARSGLSPARAGGNSISATG
jgi:hypothetical protein